jgi:hypothetical protein
MSIEKLPVDDCHRVLREQLVDEEKLETEVVCTSVAWDWMYRGVTAEGIARETTAILESAYLCRPKELQALASLGLCLHEMVRNTLQIYGERTKAMAKILDPDQPPKTEPKEGPTSVDICRGLLPCFEHLVKINNEVLEKTREQSRDNSGREKVFIRPEPDTNQNPKTTDKDDDPYDSNHYTCKLCKTELFNMYFQCNGCKELVRKNYNICHLCHEQKLFKRNEDMTKNKRQFSQYHHKGALLFVLTMYA